MVFSMGPGEIYRGNLRPDNLKLISRHFSRDILWSLFLDHFILKCTNAFVEKYENLFELVFNPI